MAEIVATLGGGEPGHAVAEERPEALGRATARLAQDRLELGEAEFNGIEVGAIGRQVPELGAGGGDAVVDALDVMGRQIVGDHNVAGLECGRQDLIDVGQETLPIHRTVEHARRRQPLDTQGGNEGARLPPALRRVVGDPLSASAASIPTDQIGGDTAFIEKDEAQGIQCRSGRLPVVARRADIRPVVFGRAYRFF